MNSEGLGNRVGGNSEKKNNLLGLTHSLGYIRLFKRLDPPNPRHFSQRRDDDPQEWLPFFKGGFA
jgi:hypothetical protein